MSAPRRYLVSLSCATAMISLSLFAHVSLGAALGATQGATDSPPKWAYPVAPAGSGGASSPPDEGLKRVPNSDLALTRAQVNNSFNVPDWHPDGHPPAPDFVLHGRAPGTEACAHCHMPNGVGTSLIQAAALAGLPASYILQQIADFKNGLRKPADNAFGPGKMMPFLLKQASDEDLKVAAEYFASISPKPWIRVVETAKVPANKISGIMYVPVAGGAREPIGMRIIELPEDLERTQLRDSESGYVAYVPPGSIRKGQVLVTTGGRDKTVPCTICHGPDLKGVGPVPPIAGRSPSYIVRQLYDIQQGSRAGAWSALMKPVVAKLTPADMVAIAAYTSSRAP